MDVLIKAPKNYPAKAVNYEPEYIISNPFYLYNIAQINGLIFHLSWGVRSARFIVNMPFIQVMRILASGYLCTIKRKNNERTEA